MTEESQRFANLAWQNIARRSDPLPETPQKITLLIEPENPSIPKEVIIVVITPKNNRIDMLIDDTDLNPPIYHVYMTEGDLPEKVGRFHMGYADFNLKTENFFISVPELEDIFNPMHMWGMAPPFYVPIFMMLQQDVPNVKPITIISIAASTGYP